MQYLIPFFVGLVITFLGCLLSFKLFPKLGLMDRPERYGHNREPVPYSVGMFIFLAVMIGIFIFLPLDPKIIAFMISATLLVGVSFLDDRYNISPAIRLFVQFLAALIIVISGVHIEAITNPFGGVIPLNQYVIPLFGNLEFMLFSDIFIILWLIFMTNAINWIDGLNGLASGVSFIACIVIFALSVSAIHFLDQTAVSYISILLAGSLLAFWFFDFAPAKLLMGDTGSMFLGFTLGVLAILSGGKIATAALVLGWPLIDFFWVIIRRILHGQLPWKGDLLHFHHKMVKAGIGERKVVVFVYFISAAFGATALISGSMSKFILIVVLLLVMLGIGAVLSDLHKEG